jgi:hypothetical protein
MEISKQDFKDWLNHPISKLVFAAVREERDYVKESMTNFSDIMTDDKLERKLARYVGIYEGLDYLLDIRYESIIEDQNDENQTGGTPSVSPDTSSGS